MTPWLTTDEAAARLRISTKTLYRLVAEGKLRAARIGGRRSLRFLAEWLDAYAESTAEPVEERRTA